MSGEMTNDAMEQHAVEVRQGQRFEFGKNWARFLAHLTDERIQIAERSMIQLLGRDKLDGARFLDIGSGSGLFSLVARRLGAEVTSFDYDPNSVACTSELRRRYFPEDPNWRVMSGSVLDPQFVSSLGQFDIVYSWGVLHHTGAMESAFSNALRSVAAGGQLCIAIYNDLGAKTDWWWRIKHRYNSLPRLLRFPFALGIVGAAEARILASHLRRRELMTYVSTWTDYKNLSSRGMSRWHDWIDWIGGFPYERADIDTIVDRFGRDGFLLENLISRSHGTGCNEFVFRRVAGVGTVVPQNSFESRWLARRFGHPVTQAKATPGAGFTGQIATPVPTATFWFALQHDRFLGEIPPPTPDGETTIPHELAGAPDFDPAQVVVVPGRCVAPAIAPKHERGMMWSFWAPELASLADDVAERTGPYRSPVFVFEDGKQLGPAHSILVDVERLGGGRFSHWGPKVYFSSSDGSDPASNNRSYLLVVADPLVPPPAHPRTSVGAPS